MQRLLVPLFALLWLALGCSSSTSPGDAGADAGRRDGGPGPGDAGPGDAGPGDAGPGASNPKDVLTYHNDLARTGQYLSETVLTPSAVKAATFGLKFTLPVDGKVDAEPLYVNALAIPGKGVHNVLFVATEQDSVYAFDADSNAGDSAMPLWKTSVLGAGEAPSDARNCDQVVPVIGITATPVIDRVSGTMYVVAMSKKPGTGTYFQRIHALDLATGAEKFAQSPVTVQASYPGTGENSGGGFVVFDPAQYKDRAALLLLNGKLYTSWSSHCDIQPYTAWVMAYDAKTLAQTDVLNLTPNGSEGAMWSSGAGPAADSSGNIYVLTGNGTFDTTLDGGFPVNADYGNAFVRMGTTAGLQVTDYFAAFNTVRDSAADTDLGSGGLMLLPDEVGSAGHRHLVVGAGKNHDIYLVDRDQMGHFNPANNDQIVQYLPGALKPSGNDAEFGMPAYFNGAVFYGAETDVLRRFTIAGAQLSATPTSISARSYPYPGATPSISANAAALASTGIVWAHENSDPAVLHAYDANDLTVELYNSNQAAGGRDHFGAGNKFIVPLVANGKVYVGTQNSVAVFGPLP